jgi:hypothetical protein
LQKEEIMMRAVVADETGLLKVINLLDRNSRRGRNAKYDDNESNYDIAQCYGEQSRAYSIVGLNRLHESETKFSVLRKDGQLELWEMEDEDGSLEIKSFTATSITDSVNSVEFWNDNTSAIVSFGVSGDVVISKLDEDRSEWTNSVDGSVPESARFSVKSPLSAASTCRDGIAFGGNENDLKMYDIETLQPAWSASNVPFDKLRLRVPIWITSLSFMQPQKDSISKANLVTGTGHKHIRLYDTSAGQRPVCSLDCGEFRVSSLCVGASPDGVEMPHQVYVGDVSGGLNMWDLRMNRKVGTMKGSVGSIRDIQMDSSNSYLASVGLDRILHVYKTATNKVAHSVYLKNRLNRCILFAGSTNASNRDVAGDESDDEDGDEEEEDEDDDVLRDYVDSDEEDEEVQRKTVRKVPPSGKKVSSRVDESDEDNDGEVDISDDEDVDLGSDDEADALDYQSASDDEMNRNKPAGGKRKAFGQGGKKAASGNGSKGQSKSHPKTKSRRSR